jgi:hypothetical protein
MRKKMLHSFGQPIQKKHCQDSAALPRTHRTSWCRLQSICQHFITLRFLLGFLSKKTRFKRHFFNTKQPFVSNRPALVQPAMPGAQNIASGIMPPT